ncbi:MAG: sugar ABC transporter ATP-binding protein [Ferruginibacter sp.]
MKLCLKNIAKSFEVVKALQDVSLEFHEGEVHAICGENGAGKSTLMNILTGNIQPDTGSILLDNLTVTIHNNQHARSLGINIVYQERSLTDGLSVAENIFPLPPTKSFGRINFLQLHQQTKALLQQLEIREFLPETMVGTLSPAQKTQVEIAKALATNPAILLLDEPTASLTDKETTILFSVIRTLKQRGVTVLYISHRMAEIKLIADRVSVLKDGKYQDTLLTNSCTTEDIIRLMVGRDLQQVDVATHAIEEVALSVKNFCGKGFKDISFDLKKGEILGLGGLVGAGRTELVMAIFGATPAESGTILKNGQSIHNKHPKQGIANGIAYLPEERKTLGVFLQKSIAENIVSAQLYSKGYSEKINIQKAGQYSKTLNIRCASVHQLMSKLSGGNQQKVVLAKWLNTQPDILIVDEPTHGIDIGAKREIYKILKQLTAAGKSILLISSEMEELLLLSDRIAVMREGKLKGILNKMETSENQIIYLAAQ